MNRVPHSHDELRKLYNEHRVDDTNPQGRGFVFEEILYSLFYNEGLEPRTSYKKKGEQIDGSFFWQGMTYLVEAKWTKEKLPASAIYAFKGKLDGKFHTTSGVFISMGGFSGEAEDALIHGKTLNTLLFDGDDIEYIMNHDVPFLDVLKYKLRQAGDIGSLHSPYVKDHETLIETDILAFIEGRDSKQVFEKTLSEIGGARFLSSDIQVIEGLHGFRQIPAITNSKVESSKLKGILIIVDNDLDSEGHLRLEKVEEQIKSASITVSIMTLFLSKEDIEEIGTFTEYPSMLSNHALSMIDMFYKDTYDAFHYDPEKDIPSRAMEAAMERLDWDFKRKLITSEDDSGIPFELSTLQELIDFVEEEAIQAMQGEMPASWLKEQSYLDYSTEAQEFLYYNYMDQIKKMTWSFDNL